MTAAIEVHTRYDAKAVSDWLFTMHARSAGHIWLGSQHDQFRGRCFDTRNPGWVRNATAYVEQLDRTGTPGIYLRTTTLTDEFVQRLRANPREVGRGGDDDSLSLPGLAADLDLAGPGHKTTKPLPPDPATARAIIDESGLPDPSVWVHSGGGLYAWWLLDKPHTIDDDLARIKRLTARWQDPIAAASQRLGYSYGRLGDLARILRVPGTVNRKRGMPEPRPCQVLEDSGRRYSLENIRAALTDALHAMPAIEPVRITYRAAVPRPDGGLTAWADFEARVDWAQILEPHGWTLNHVRGNVRYWTRPGKDRRDGFSASTGRDTARDRLYVFSDATVFEQNRPYVKFHAYRLLNGYGDDWQAAAHELERRGFGTPFERRRVAA